jgi:L-ribulose-5-phosphate 4-epimerase
VEHRKRNHRTIQKSESPETTGVLVAGHAPFCWGTSVTAAAHTAVVVEELAHLAFLTVSLNPGVKPVTDVLRDKHFLRKHGADAYYGQQNW